MAEQPNVTSARKQSVVTLQWKEAAAISCGVAMHA